MKDDLIKTYMEAGLDEIFAKQIVDTPENKELIIELWNAKWRKQCNSKDIIFKSPLY